MSLEFHEYSRIFKRPIPASYFKVFQALGITWIFKNIQAHKSWKFLEIPSSIFLQGGLENGREGHVKFCPYENGGGGGKSFLSMLKGGGGHSNFWSSFYPVARSFSHIERGGGAKRFHSKGCV